MIVQLLQELPSHPAFSEREGPAFAEPWQAELFGLTLQLSRQHLFSWADWVDGFSAEVARHPQRPDETVEQAYYRQWFAALEPRLQDLGVSRDEIDEAQEHWRRSYLATPHGQPIVFSREARPIDDHSHEGEDPHHHHGHEVPAAKPVFVSPPQRGAE